MAAPRAFISFQMEDRWAREFLVGHAHNKNNDIKFTDYSVHEPFNEKWKTNCRARVQRPLELPAHDLTEEVTLTRMLPHE